MLNIDELFRGRYFGRDIIILCVRWYLRFKLSFRDLVEMTAERGIALVHTTIMRWVQRYVPEFEKRWNRFACQPNGMSLPQRPFFGGRSGARADCLARSCLTVTKPHTARPEYSSPDIRAARGQVSNYLNNLIEQDLRPVKLRLGPMHGFKGFRTASITIAGVELMH